jgi:hypothetical protein
MSTTNPTTSPARRTHSGRLVSATVFAAGAIAALMTLTAPTAGATTAQNTCKTMGGSYSSKTATNGKTVESCSVDEGSGPVVGYWIDGKWQGAYRQGQTTTLPIPPVNRPPVAAQ